MPLGQINTMLMVQAYFTKQQPFYHILTSFLHQNTPTSLFIMFMTFMQLPLKQLNAATVASMLLMIY